MTRASAHAEQLHTPEKRERTPTWWLRLVLLSFGFAVAAGCLDITEVQLGELHVRVVDDHGVAVRGVQVEPHGGWHWWPRRAVGFTDTDGRVHFRLPPTIYRVFAHPPDGYHHRDPPHWATMKEVRLTEDGASVVLELGRTVSVPDDGG